MSDTPDRDSQTEDATPRRQQRARDEGQVAISRECIALAVLAAAALVLALLAGPMASASARHLAALLHRAGDADLATELPALFTTASRAAIFGAAPMLAIALVAGAAAVLAQSGFLFNATPLHPKLSHLNPLAGLKRLFGVEGLAELIRSLAKLGALGLALWWALGGQGAVAVAALTWSEPLLLEKLRQLSLRLLLAVLAAQAAIALADLIWVRLRHARSLRMSKQELREETKDTEGDPRIKARIRQIRLLRARRRMMAAIPNAAVVITNPTHYAVALAYDRAQHAAPRVVAKGVDSMAARIREAAASHRVPIVANPALARALYRVELEDEIPMEHFKAVAEIIAYVWRLERRVNPNT